MLYSRNAEKRIENFVKTNRRLNSILLVIVIFFLLFRLAVGVGDNPCDLTWPGYFAFSDPEAQALADFVSYTNNGNWTVFFTMHSYSQIWMLPYGYTGEQIEDYEKLVCEQNTQMAAIALRSGT